MAEWCVSGWDAFPEESAKTILWMHGATAEWGSYFSAGNHLLSSHHHRPLTILGNETLNSTQVTWSWHSPCHSPPRSGTSQFILPHSLCPGNECCLSGIPQRRQSCPRKQLGRFWNRPSWQGKLEEVVGLSDGCLSQSRESGFLKLVRWELC